MRISNLIYASVLTVLVASCVSDAEKASKVVRAFATATTAKDTATVFKAYPNCKEFYDKVPDLSDFEIQNSVSKDSIVVVTAVSSFYDEKNNFIQKNLTFWAKKQNGEFVIYDSNGIIEIPEILAAYANRKANLNSSSTDCTLSQKLGIVATQLYVDYQTCVMKLNRGIERVSWSWECDYGSPHGRCTIKNNLPFAVKNVKYKVTYYKADDVTVVGTDEGTVSYDAIGPGEMKSFTFYSSGVNGYPARRANIKFEVPDDYAYEWVLSSL